MSELLGMKGILETIDGKKATHIVVNKLEHCYSTSYSSEERAEEEAIAEGVIYGAENVEVIKYTNQQLIDETTVMGGDVKVDNTKMIESNGAYYKNK